MGLFGKSKNAIDFDDIASVIIMEQTNLFKNQSNWGATFGGNILDGDAFVTNQCVPAGTEIKFSVTYKNGKKEIVKAMSGSAICDRLLQMAIDPPVVNSGPTGDNIEKVTDDYKPFKIEKNQIPTGTYIIGEDIPEGIYDFTWVFGAGTIKLLQVAEDNTISNMDYF